jgi:pimeloyl-ACP methyl ester carboxylesterase
MKKQILRIILVSALIVTLSVPASISVYAKQPKAHVDLTNGFDEQGTLNGAEYRIRVPANWNGTLLVYAHGFSPTLIPQPVPIAPGIGPASSEEALLDAGYALAGSAFSVPGNAIKEGIQDTHALTNYFKGQVGNPEHVIVWGTSLGSGVALTCIEKYPGIYDGAIADSGLLAGLPMHGDMGLAFLLAYAVAFDWPEAWGPLGDLRDDLDFMTEVLPTILPQYIDGTNFGKWEFVRLVTDYPSALFWTPSPFGLPWPLINFLFYTGAVDPVVQNLDHVYSLEGSEIAYLSGLGVNADALLDEMNASTNIEASKKERKYIERYCEFSGDITCPVITLHNQADPLAHVSYAGVYRDLVVEAGKDDLLLQVFTEEMGHGVFTANQYVLTVKAMKDWLDTGFKPLPPDSAAFPESAGFIENFEIPDWPF